MKQVVGDMTQAEMRQYINKSMSEREFQDQVITLAKVYDWMCVHFRPALTSDGRWLTHIQGDVGFPDLVLARRGRVIMAELKSEKGKWGPGQLEWKEALGLIHYLWRPHDIDLIEEILSEEVE